MANYWYVYRRCRICCRLEGKIILTCDCLLVLFCQKIEVHLMNKFGRILIEQKTYGVIKEYGESIYCKLGNGDLQYLLYICSVYSAAFLLATAALFPSKHYSFQSAYTCVYQCSAVYILILYFCPSL